MPARQWITLAITLLVSAVLTGCDPPKTASGTGSSGNSGSGRTGNSKTTTAATGATVRITASDKTCWAGQIGTANRKGCGSATFQLRASKGAYRVNLRKTKGVDGLSVVLVVNGKKVDRGRISSSSSVVAISYASG